MSLDAKKVLESLASEIVKKVSEENEPRYPNDPWLKQTMREHIEHARDHLFMSTITGGVFAPDDAMLNNLESALWRVAAAIYKLRETREKCQKTQH